MSESRCSIAAIQYGKDSSKIAKTSFTVESVAMGAS